jgi:hypothetical protein
MARGALRSQAEDGSWPFRPDEQRKSLGQPGDTVIGLCAPNAFTLLKFARITGDEECLQAGLKALEFMERFHVPRGAQSWECPLYEPDVLASAWAVGAYVEGFRCTRDNRWLADAEYWARTGLPFLYSWQLPDRPGQLYASIPVFGTTFYTHSWLGVPVQWNGLVYAYQLQHLAEAMGSYWAGPYWPRMPGEMHQAGGFWQEIARGITVSAMHQQFAEGELKGTYPDGFYGYFTNRAGPYINPEDILVNALALEGHDPDISTVILRDHKPRVHISSGAKVADAERDGQTLRFTLTTFPQVASHTLITGVGRPQAVEVEGRPLSPAEDLEEVKEGYGYDEAKGWLYLKAWHEREEVRVVVRL